MSDGDKARYLKSHTELSDSFAVTLKPSSYQLSKADM